VPVTSVNKALDALLENKPRLVLFNKVDLADPRANARLKEHFKVRGRHRYQALFGAS